MHLANFDSPILITGIERSGASIIAKIIAECGVLAGNINNRMEHKQIKEFVDSYYNYIGADVNGQYPLPVNTELFIPSNWKASTQKAICSERWTDEQTWLYKSSRIAQIWPIWNETYPNAKWIIVRRRTGDLLESCKKTAYMNAFKNPVNQKAVGASDERGGWLWWIHQQEQLQIKLFQKVANCKIVWPERMACGDYEQMKETVEWLGLQWNDSIEKSTRHLFINSKQWKDV